MLTIFYEGAVMSFYVGIDLYSNNNFIGIIDKKDCRILSKKLPNDMDMVLNTLKPLKSMRVSGGQRSVSGRTKLS